jgi:glycosyltransferase involved in cell wall biosynthesis
MISWNVVVPLSRPSDLPNVLSNYARQTYPHKSLLLVLNGPALALELPAGFPGEAVRSARATTAGAAKNVALDLLRARGARHVAVMDSDDYYGPGYLAEQANHMPFHPLVGKNQHFVVDDRGFWLINPYSHSFAYHWCSGGVQCFDLQATGRFSEAPTHEDVNFVNDVVARGGHLYVSSPHHYLYNRQGAQHTYQDDIIARARDWNLQIVYLGPTVDLDIVNGLKRVAVAKDPTKMH